MTRTYWVVLGLIMVLLIGAGMYFNAWKIAVKVLPILETFERTSVSPATAFTVPDGFKVSIFASDVPGARVIIQDPKGTLLVSETSEGKVVALPDPNTDGVADQTLPVLTGLSGPHGLALKCADTCTLYVAEETKVVAYKYDPTSFTATEPVTIATLPDSGGGHSTRTLLLAPDGNHLLVMIGSSCNVCTEESPLRASIQSIDLGTNTMTEYAKGLRNTVFAALNPITGDVWGTDMGRDLLGDDIPPDEINILKQGADYGWPNCYANNIHDTDFDKNTYIRNPCMEPFETPPTIQIQAHSAPLGIAFVPEEGWPELYRNDILIALHGSWNRSSPVGYKIVRYDSTGTYLGEAADFMTGFIDSKGTVIGRPVGLLALPGGVLYVTDDRAGAVYKVSVTRAP